jgi:hypothetical protein
MVDQPAPADVAPADAPPKSPRPLKANLLDQRNRPGQWYMKAEGEEWTLVISLPDKELATQQGKGLAAGVQAFLNEMIAFLTQRDGQHVDMLKEIRRNPSKFVRPGFRPVYALNQVEKMRARYAMSQTGNQGLLEGFVKNAVAQGWPAVEVGALPTAWRTPPPKEPLPPQEKGPNDPVAEAPAALAPH